MNIELVEGTHSAEEPSGASTKGGEGAGGDIESGQGTPKLLKKESSSGLIVPGKIYDNVKGKLYTCEEWLEKDA